MYVYFITIKITWSTHILCYKPNANSLGTMVILIFLIPGLWIHDWNSVMRKERFGPRWYWQRKIKNSHSYTHLIFDKGTKNIQWWKDSLFNKCCWEKWLSTSRKLKLDPCLSPCTSVNSKWIKDLIRSKTLQLVHKRAGNTLETIGIGKDFLSRTAAAQQLRERMDKWDCMKWKSFCTTKEMVSKLKRPLRVGKNIF
jgi:hypothetical protein